TFVPDEPTHEILVHNETADCDLQFFKVSAPFSDDDKSSSWHRPGVGQPRAHHPLPPPPPAGKSSPKPAVTLPPAQRRCPHREWARGCVAEHAPDKPPGPPQSVSSAHRGFGAPGCFRARSRALGDPQLRGKSPADPFPPRRTHVREKRLPESECRPRAPAAGGGRSRSR